MAEESCKPPAEHPHTAELQALVQRIQAGDPNALPELRALLDEHPEVAQRVGDLAAWVEQAWLTLLANDHPLAVETLQRKAAELKGELLGERPSVIERLLVDHIVAAWLETHCAELQQTQACACPAQATLRLKRLESATKRYVSAMKTLTQLRALLPAVLNPGTSLRLFEPQRRAV